METTEKIVESYVRYVKGWATIPNIKFGNREIDLIAVDPVSDSRYHIETSVSISHSYSKLTAKPFDPEKRKQRVQAAGQKMTLGFFREAKFSHPEVRGVLRRYGFKQGNYEKVIVVWGATDDARRQAKKHRIVIWAFPDILLEVTAKFQNLRTYFADDTLRTLQLYQRAVATQRS